MTRKILLAVLLAAGAAACSNGPTGPADPLAGAGASRDGGAIGGSGVDEPPPQDTTGRSTQLGSGA